MAADTWDLWVNGTFSVQGSDLTDDVVINPPSSYEISETSGSGFTSDPITLVEVGGTVSETIYVRLKADLDIGDYNESIIVSSEGATDAAVSCEGKVIKPEPDNHVADLNASPGIPPYRAINLSWTDASGGTEPDGYLVLASTADDIANPVDGVEPVPGMMTKYVNQGEKGVSFADFNPSTLYYFKVFPFTNSGTNINYKITEPAPSDSHTTGAFPTGYFADFEGDGETKTGYASGTVTLSGLQWNLTEALIGTSGSDFKFNIRSVRLQGYGTSAMTMLEDKMHGAGQVSFYHKRYGTDTQTPFIVEYSTDGGDSWTQIGDAFTATENIQYFSEELNVPGSVRIKNWHRSFHRNFKPPYEHR